MAIKGTKHDDSGTEEDQQAETISTDQISELPDAVIGHILSFLPTVDAVRTCLLSRRWRRAWTLVSSFDFCSKPDPRPWFPKFVDECLNRGYADLRAISKFKLDVTNGTGSQANGWLRFLSLRKVKEIDFRISRMMTCFVPRRILQLESLTLLRLHGLVLDIASPASLPSLKELRLDVVTMNDCALSNLLLGCVSLEKLCLNVCYGFQRPEVLILSLKYMEFRACESVCRFRSIKVEAINLLTFLFFGSSGRGRECNVNLVGCREIRNLWLSSACLSDRWLEDSIPQLPQLESLNLYHCYGFQRIKISNQHLKNFELRYSNLFDTMVAEINTPNLVRFRYRGHSMLTILVNAPNLLDASIDVSNFLRMNYDNEWYEKLLMFLSQFHSCEIVRIICSNTAALTIPEALREIVSPPLRNLKSLAVKAGDCSLRDKELFKESLRWIAPSLETLSIIYRAYFF